MAELWDAYMADGKKAGFDLERNKNKEIPAGIYHLVCEALVRHKDGDILVMQRDYDKSGYPGMFEHTAGGSALKGEDALACIRRELFEETGIAAREFTELNCTVSEKTHSIYRSYLCIVNCDKRTVRLQAGETIAYRWLKPMEFKDFMKDGRLIPTQTARFEKYLRQNGLYYGEK